MTPSTIYQAINEAYSDWYGLLANPRFCRDGNCVSWTRFDGGRLKDPITTTQLLQVIRAGQFSFQSAEDGSIFQILYCFDSSGELQIARLAFYFLRVRGSFEDETAELVSSSWIRFDYDRASANGLLHNDCHLHIHGFPDSRMVVSGVPGPRQFIELVVALCYPDLYRVHRLTDDGSIQDPGLLAAVNECLMPGSSSASTCPLIHVSVPR